MRKIELGSVWEARSHVYRAAIRTPLVRLNFPEFDREVYLKLESLQPIGSFKIRGAFNAIRKLPSEALAQGVWTVSAGNAAQGVALAAKVLGARASVLMMDTAPQTKLSAVERLGASIVRASYDECWRTVEARSSDRMSGVFVHPFDDPAFIAGNGTLGLEILEDLPDVDAVIAPLGGGGLLAGIHAVMRELRPACHVYAAEPQTAAPLAHSLRSGEPGYFPNWKASFVDGAGGKSVLPSMWPLLSQLSGSIVVALDEIAAAMRLAAERNHVIAEGAAGCALAAALRSEVQGRKIVAVVSGGNIDLAKFAELVGNAGDAN